MLLIFNIICILSVSLVYTICFIVYNIIYIFMQLAVRYLKILELLWPGILIINYISKSNVNVFFNKFRR